MDDSYLSNNGEAPQSPLSVEEARKVFGQNLRKIREALGQSQKDLIHLTRISPPFIEALERGDFDVLPGEVFGRGFVKNICKALDVENEALLAEFSQCWGKAPPKTKLAPGPGASFKAFAMRDRLKKLINLSKYFSGRALLTYAAAPLAAIFLGTLLISKIRSLPKAEPIAEQAAAEVVEPKTQEDPAELQARAAEASSALLPEVIKSGIEPKDQTFVVESQVTPAIEQAAGPEVHQQNGAHTQEKSNDPMSGLSANKTPAISDQVKLNPDQLLVKLIVLETVHVSFKKDKDKGEVKKVELAPGTHNFEFSTRAELWVEDPAKVEVFFNNRSLGRNEKDHEAKRMTFYGKPEKDRALF